MLDSFCTNYEVINNVPELKPSQFWGMEIMANDHNSIEMLTNRDLVSMKRRPIQ